MNQLIQENIITTGQKSPICSEEGLIPVADSYISHYNIYNLRSEEANMLFQKGNKICVGRRCSTETRQKISKANQGKTRTDELCQRFSNLTTGENNPNYGKHHSYIAKEIISKTHKGKPLTEEHRLKISEASKKRRHSEKTKIKIAIANTGIIFTEERKNKIALSRIGKSAGDKNPNWRGGTSFYPYCEQFNNGLKEKIRNRDNRTCQLCGKKENGHKLMVHHIHYDKPNCDPDLISLCHSCHSKVNFNRDYYEKMFMDILNRRNNL